MLIPWPAVLTFVHAVYPNRKSRQTMATITRLLALIILISCVCAISGSETGPSTKRKLLSIPKGAHFMGPVLRALREPVSNLADGGPVSGPCVENIIAWYENEDSDWALQLLDAMSKVPEGILTGHFNTYGDFDECLATRAEFTYAGLPGSFKGQYCTGKAVPESECENEPGDDGVKLLEFQPSSDTDPPRGGLVGEFDLGEILQPLFDEGYHPEVAVCMPNSCSKQDIGSFLQFALAVANQTGYCVQVNQCQTDDPPELRPGDIIMITVLVSIAGLCIIGTALDLINQRRQEENPSARSVSKGVQALIAFSVYTNTRKWLSTAGGSDNLGCIHGIRFLSSCWVVLAHTWTEWRAKVWNQADLWKIYEDWTIYPIINGTLSVDTFFTMAGILAAYNLLKVLDKTKGRLNVPLLYLHRYLRLTPTYAILIGIMATIFEYMRPGPNNYELVNSGSSCRAHWWHNLLYFNNLVRYGFEDPGKGMCHVESWYLGNDMQFFLVSPLLLWPLWKWSTIGTSLMALVTVASVVVPFTITYIERIDGTLIASTVNGPEFQEFFRLSYTKPWMRFGPYIVGLWAGYLLYTIRKGKARPKLPPWVVVFGWLTSAAFALGAIFGPMPLFDPDVEYLRVGSALYAALHRFGWGLSISWVVLACTMGYGGPINEFLSWKVFIPLGRLTFCVYLISFQLQSLFYLSLRQAVTYDRYMGINLFFAHLVMSLLVSFVACMAFESPFIALEKLIFGGAGGAKEKPAVKESSEGSGEAIMEKKSESDSSNTRV